MREMAAESNSRPIMSSSYHRLLKPPKTLRPFHGDRGRRCSLAAFLMFRKSDKANGKKAAGSTIVQRPYPHLQVACLSRLLAIGEPTQTVIKNGTSGRLEKRALFSKSLVSAMKDLN